MALPIVDAFTSGSTQALSTYNAAWVVENGGFEVRSSGYCFGTVDSTTSFARRNDETFNAEHISDVVIGSLAGSVYIGAAVGVQSGAASGYYYIVSIGGYNEFGRTNAGTDTIISSTPTQAWAGGDVLRMKKEHPDASTVRITVYHAPAADPTNFTQIYTYDDTSGSRLSGGSPGISAYANSAGTSGIDQVTLNNLAAAATADQEGARFGEDDGSESVHTWAAAQDANLTRAVGTAALIRALINGTGDLASAAYTLRYQKNGAGGYLPVNVGANSSPTLSYGAIGTLAYSAASGTSVAPAYPSGITSRSALVLLVGQKPTTANGGTVTTPSGWTLQGSRTGANDGDTGGYTTTLGADTGNTNLFVYTKDSVTGSESGTLTVTVGDNNVAWAAIIRLQSSDDCTWSFAVATGKDTSAGSVSIATGNLAVAAGDHIIGAMVIPTDVTTPAQFSAQALSQTGTTFGTVTEIAEPDSANGNDIGGFILEAPVSSGSGSGAVTMTATAGGTTTNVRGPGLVLRARVASVAREIYVEASANIAAGGEATTARLTAPSGKTTADFVTGRRWDDENGTDSIDITVDDYTEVEWLINTQSPAVNGDYFDLRVYAGSSALASYTVTPRLTISTPATSLPLRQSTGARMAPLMHF